MTEKHTSPISELLALVCQTIDVKMLDQTYLEEFKRFGEACVEDVADLLPDAPLCRYAVGFPRLRLAFGRFSVKQNTVQLVGGGGQEDDRTPCSDR